MSTKTKRVTRKQAEKVLHEVAVWLGPKMGYDGPAPTGAMAAHQALGPQLMMDFDWPSSGPCPAIVLEGGPYDWAVEVGYEIKDKLPEVYIEPYSGWALCIYPKWSE